MATQQSGYGALDGDQPSLIPPGEYELAFDYFETKILFKKPKLFVWFKVIKYGDHFGVRVPRYYGLRKIIGRYGKGGRFAIGWKSDFLREYARLFGAPKRLDRIAMTPFEKVVIVGRIRTVEKGHDQREIHDSLRYSVIDELIRVKDGSVTADGSFPSPVPSPPPT